MAISQVIFNNSKLIDLTNDTITPEGLQKGLTAHAANGELIVGTGSGDENVSFLKDDYIITSYDDVDIGLIPILSYAYFKNSFSKNFDIFKMYTSNDLINISGGCLIIGKNIDNYHALFALVNTSSYTDIEFPKNGVKVTDASYMFAYSSISIEGALGLRARPNSRVEPTNEYFPNYNFIDGVFIIPNNITNTSHMFYNASGLAVPVIYGDNIIDCSWMFSNSGYVLESRENDNIYQNIANNWRGFPLHIPNNAINISGFYSSSTFNFKGMETIIIPESVEDASYLFYSTNFQQHPYSFTSIKLHNNIKSTAYMFSRCMLYPSIKGCISVPDNAVNIKGMFANTNFSYSQLSYNIPHGTNGNTFPDSVRDASYFAYNTSWFDMLRFMNRIDNSIIIKGDNVNFVKTFMELDKTSLVNKVIIEGNNLNCVSVIGYLTSSPYHVNNLYVNGDDINISCFYTPNVYTKVSNFTIQLYGNNIDASYLFTNKTGDVNLNYFTFKGNNINLYKAFYGSKIGINNLNYYNDISIDFSLENLNNVNMGFMFWGSDSGYGYQKNKYINNISGDNINLYNSNIISNVTFGILENSLNIIGNNINAIGFISPSCADFKTKIGNLNFIGNDISFGWDMPGSCILFNMHGGNANFIGNNIHILPSTFKAESNQENGVNLLLKGNNINAVGIATNFNIYNINGYNVTQTLRYKINANIKGSSNLNLSYAFYGLYDSTYKNSKISVEPDNSLIGYDNCNFVSMFSDVYGYSIYIFPNGKIIGNNLNLSWMFSDSMSLTDYIYNDAKEFYVKGDNINLYHIKHPLFKNRNNITKFTFIGNNINLVSLNGAWRLMDFNNVQFINIKGNNLNAYCTFSNLIDNNLNKINVSDLNINIVSDNSVMSYIFANINYTNKYGDGKKNVNIKGNNIDLFAAFSSCIGGTRGELNIIGNDINCMGLCSYSPDFFSNINIIGNNIVVRNFFTIGSEINTPFYLPNIIIDGKNINYYGMYGLVNKARPSNLFIKNIQGVDNKSHMFNGHNNAYYGPIRVYCDNADNILCPWLWSETTTYYDVFGFSVQKTDNYNAIGWSTVTNGYYNSRYNIYIYNNYVS